MLLKGRSITFSPAKGAWLCESRGIGFERILLALEHGVAHNTIKHPNAAKYPHQMMLEIIVDGYGYAIPFVVEDDGGIFMKTIYPSRKVTEKFKKGF